MRFRDDQVRRAGRGAGHGRVSVGTGGAWFTSLRKQIGDGEHRPRATFLMTAVLARPTLGWFHLDGLALEKKLVVMVNTALMDNHQATCSSPVTGTTFNRTQSQDEQAFPDLVDP
ncbi:hypothetical protein GQ600_21465 [Phytophthora cactorum]|nr:hypothetical protein GQ600_21465 [Phytophthora cactorum]